jgi:hypothetical protein
VSATLLEKAPAKINLTLRVLGRRADGYHEIESLVAFADFGDMLTLRTDAEEGLEITGPFGGKSGPITDNLVLKAVAAGRERVAGLQAGRFLLEKNIPVSVAVRRMRRRLCGLLLASMPFLWMIPYSPWPPAQQAPTCPSVFIRVRGSCAVWASGYLSRSNCRRCRHCWSIHLCHWLHGMSSAGSPAHAVAVSRMMCRRNSIA